MEYTHGNGGLMRKFQKIPNLKEYLHKNTDNKIAHFGSNCTSNCKSEFQKNKVFHSYFLENYESVLTIFF